VNRLTARNPFKQLIAVDRTFTLPWLWDSIATSKIQTTKPQTKSAHPNIEKSFNTDLIYNKSNRFKPIPLICVKKSANASKMALYIHWISLSQMELDMVFHAFVRPVDTALPMPFNKLSIQVNNYDHILSLNINPHDLDSFVLNVFDIQYI
jgi:hypothetical protein